jgi:hypothetical protein
LAQTVFDPAATGTAADAAPTPLVPPSTSTTGSGTTTGTGQ